MRLANVAGRASAITADGGVDLHGGSDGRFPSVSDDVIPLLEEVTSWLDDAEPELDPGLSIDALTADPARLGPPVARPRQVFAVGLNYRSHADESGLEPPEHPMIFTKFPSSIGGPAAEIPIVADTVDWEVELVAVVGEGGTDIAADAALDHLAGFCVGQDVSERTLQMANQPPQFSLAKSYRNFAPIGPWLTTLDELADPEDLAIECGVGDEKLQSSRTSNMLFDIPVLVSYLSGICELLPGDLIFTGTPEGVGMGRTPPRYLEVGMELVTTIEGLGSLRNRCIAG